MSSTLISDVRKQDYHRFGNIIDESGHLSGEIIYSIPLRELDTLDAKGDKQVEMMNIKFEQGLHIEEVRRAMNKWADAQDFNLHNDALWVHLGYYELMSDGNFRKFVEVKQSMRQ